MVGTAGSTRAATPQHELAGIVKKAPALVRMEPTHALPGGKVTIHGQGFEPAYAYLHRVYFGEARAQIARVSAKKISVVVPEDADSNTRVEYENLISSPIDVSVGKMIAEQLHPVTNPVFDNRGRLYTTLSGSRGEKVPVSIFRIESIGLDPASVKVKPFLSEILNPTGLAWGDDDHLYVSSRHDGSIYRVNQDLEVELIVDELGIASGIAFDPEGILHVGDRRGTVYRIERNGEPRAFCRLEPSISAYHLAFSPAGDLFVTGPSLSSSDPVFRIDPSGKVETFAEGFGRPQGMTFAADGNLYVTEGLTGSSGLYRVEPDGSRHHVVSAPPLVGIALTGTGSVILAATSSVYEIGLDVFP